MARRLRHPPRGRGARAKIVNELHTGSYVVPDRITLGQWVRDRWLLMIESRVKPSTFHSYRSNMETHVLSALGQRPVQQLTAAMLNTLYAPLLARGNGRGPLSPIPHHHPQGARGRGGCRSRDGERGRAREAATPGSAGDAGDQVLGGGGTPSLPRPRARHSGRGSVAPPGDDWDAPRRDPWPAWRDVDLDAARISVRHAAVSVAYAVVESTPKSHQAGVIDLAPETVRLLRTHRNRQELEREQWGSAYCDNELVVAKESGESIHPQSFTEAFDRLVTRPGLRGIRLHGLRHTHATIAIKAGVPVKVVNERLATLATNRQPSRSGNTPMSFRECRPRELLRVPRSSKAVADNRASA